MARPGGVIFTSVGAGAARVVTARLLGTAEAPGNTVALGVLLVTGKVTAMVADMVCVLVGVLLGVLVAVEFELAVGVNVGVLVEADSTELVLACRAMPIATPRNSRIGTAINARARRRRSGRGEAAASAVRSVVRVASTR